MVRRASLTASPSGEEPTCQCRRHRFNPCVGKIPWRRRWQPSPVFLPGESHGQRSLAGYSPRIHRRVEPNLVTEPPAPSYTILTALLCMAVCRGTSLQATPLNHHGFQVDHGLDQGECRNFWEKMKDEEVDRNLKAQMVEEMELAVLKNICHCTTLHPLSIYKYPSLPALLLLHKTPAERNRYKEQLRARDRCAEQKRLEESRLPDVGQVHEFDSGAGRLTKLKSESTLSLAKRLFRQRKGAAILHNRTTPRSPSFTAYRPALVAGRQD